MASAMRGRSTSFNDGAPEYERWGPNETEAFYKYWDSPERVQRGKERKAAWDAMDPNEARSIRRARRKELKAERLRNSRPEAAQRMREGAERVRGRLAEYRAGKSSGASNTGTRPAPENTSEPPLAVPYLDEASGASSTPGMDNKPKQPSRMAGDVFNNNGSDIYGNVSAPTSFTLNW